jgi:hypothetical protein
MVKRPLATFGAIFAVLATLCVFLPWYSLTVSLGAAGEQTYTYSGFESDFLGMYTIILSGLGAIATITVASFPAASLPIRPRWILAPAALLLFAAFGLTLVDVFRDAGDGELRSGILITLLGSLLAGLCCVWTIWTRAAPEPER